MARNATTFTADAAGRERARTVRLAHGAKSPTVVEPRTRRAYRRLLALLPDLPRKQRLALRLLASVQTKRELLDEWYERAGLVRRDRLDGSASFYGELARLELALLEKVGLATVAPEPESDLAIALRRRWSS